MFRQQKLIENRSSPKKLTNRKIIKLTQLQFQLEHRFNSEEQPTENQLRYQADLGQIYLFYW